MNGFPDGALIYGLRDARDQQVYVGDRVRFRYSRYFVQGYDEAPGGDEPEQVDAEGVVRLSAGRGAYIVFACAVYPIGRKRWFEVLP